MSVAVDQLRALITVAQSGSFSRAAELLGQTPSYVSRKVSGLEQQLGIRLFTRTTRKLSLTPEGSEVLGKALEAMRIIDDIGDNALSGQREPQGKLKVDAASPFLQQCIIPNIAGYQQAYPKVEIELTSFDRVVDLVENQIDIAFRIGELRDSSLHYKLIGRSRLQILASPAYLEKYGKPETPEALNQHKCLGFSQPLSLNKWPVKVAANKDGLVITPALTASSGSALRQLALGGVGVVCLAGFMTYDDIISGRLVPLLGDHVLERYQVINAVFYRDYQSSMKLNSFIDFISQSIAGRLD
ncbi:MAG: LysR family transcriptional regulator [Gammaproteobacteria bacterium]|nr:LysR family transcriptional regulator [Gammaproteobacteria bacterium]